MRYFAYGANMDPVHMAERCPKATRLGPAVLPEHGFRIAAKGYGTLLPAPGEQIHGVLWDLTPADEAALDLFEGVPEGLYRKDTATVTSGDGRRLDAMLYCAADPARGVPVPGYLERVIEVVESLDFPADYVAGLRRLLSNPGPRP